MMQIILTLQRTLTGIFCQWSILMVIFLPRLTTDCGARQDHLTEEVVMVLMLTVTGDSIGAQEGPPVILAQIPNCFSSPSRTSLQILDHFTPHRVKPPQLSNKFFHLR